MSEPQTPAPELAPLLAALVKARAEIGPVAKDSRNAQQGYAYMSRDELAARVTPVLARHGLAFVLIDAPELTRTSYATRAGGSAWHVQLTARFRLYHESGAALEIRCPGEAADAGDKAIAKALSYAEKFALRLLLGVATGDADAEAVDPPEAAPARAEHRDPSRAVTKPRRPARGAKTDAPAVERKYPTTLTELQAALAEINRDPSLSNRKARLQRVLDWLSGPDCGLPLGERQAATEEVNETLYILASA